MSIKYYQLAKDEEFPDEFCVVRDVGGEPSEYIFYVSENENARLQGLVDNLFKVVIAKNNELFDLLCKNEKLRVYCSELLHMAESSDPEWLHWPELHEELRKLNVEI
jgi:hypothetical protein